MALPAIAGSRLRGTSNANSAGWRSRPAIFPASSPAPKKTSARAGPTMAEPVSCAIITRWKGVFPPEGPNGTPAWIKKGVP